MSNNIFTKDYMSIIAIASIFAMWKWTSQISADEIFWWVVFFTKQHSYFDLFWQILDVDHEKLLELAQKLGYKLELEQELVATVAIDNDLKDYIDWLARDGHSIDFIDLLVASLDHISPSLSQQIETDIGINKISLTNNVLQMIRQRAISWNASKLMEQFWVYSEDNLNNKNFEQKNSAKPDLVRDDNRENYGSKKSENVSENWADTENNIASKPKTPKSKKNNDFDSFSNDKNDSWKEVVSIGWSEIDEDEEKAWDKKLTIEYFGSDLTKEAKNWSLDPMIGREKELNQLIYTLLRKTKNNPLLIWEAWVWKTAIVEWLAQKIVDWNVPSKLRHKKVFILDIWSLVAWTRYRWDFEARFKSLIEEASDPLNNIILFIDEIHTIIGAWSAEWTMDVANMLKPALARWKLQLIWATTFDEYQKHIEKDAALKRRFQEIIVEEPSEADAYTILEWLRSRLEDFHWIALSDEALRQSIKLSSRYVMNKHLPDKAIDLLDEASAKKSTLNDSLEEDNKFLKLEKEIEKNKKQIEKAIWGQDYFLAADLKKKEDLLKQQIRDLKSTHILPRDKRPLVDESDVWAVLAEKIWVPTNKINESEISRLKWLDESMLGKVFGQDEAVKVVTNSIKRNRLSMVQRNRPIGSFIFLGPSWVWKTYIAKLIASEYFGDEKALIRVDMSEYMDRYNVSKLIGSAPGYVWYEEWGQLTEAVRRKPYSVVLFDEIEKASKEVLNILLQILDEWHLKDAKWRLIDFKNTIIILTSNIGSERFGKNLPQIGFGRTQDKNEFEAINERVVEDLKKHLAPEMLNRIDSTIVFSPLSKENLEKIFSEKIKEFLNHWKKSWLKLPTYNKEKIKEIVEEVYDPAYWARPLDKYIFEKIEPQLIEQLLKKAK